MLHGVEEGGHGRLAGSGFPVGALLTGGVEAAQLLRQVVDAVLDLLAVDCARLDGGFLHHVERWVVEMRLVIWSEKWTEIIKASVVLTLVIVYLLSSLS